MHVTHRFTIIHNQECLWMNFEKRGNLELKNSRICLFWPHKGKKFGRFESRTSWQETKIQI